jgi:glycosyltransferase involved in cell wall biosynthesis
MNDQQTNPSVARPEISVILPVYNAAATLRQAVRSILDQSLTQIEILAVYDISKDGSENILFDIAAGDKRVRPILNTGRKLLAAALNVGIQAANAEFIARMDADDIAFPGRLERQLSFLQNNPAVAICGTAAILIEGISGISILRLATKIS